MRKWSCKRDQAHTELLPSTWQIWESVPYLASYVSPVLKEGRSIPLLPQELEATWNGKGRCGAAWQLVLVLRPESLSTTYRAPRRG